MIEINFTDEGVSVTDAMGYDLGTLSKVKDKIQSLALIVNNEWSEWKRDPSSGVDAHDLWETYGEICGLVYAYIFISPVVNSWPEDKRAPTFVTRAMFGFDLNVVRLRIEEMTE